MTSFDAFTVMGGDTTFHKDVVYANTTTVLFNSRDVVFDGPRYNEFGYDSEDWDPCDSDDSRDDCVRLFSVHFNTDLDMLGQVLFEDDVQIDRDTLMLGDVTIEGPGARRRKRRMVGSRRLGKDSSSSDDDEREFLIIGDVDTHIESDTEVVIETETDFTDDVYVGDDDRQMRMKHGRTLRDHAELHTEDVEIRGIADIHEDALFHQDLYMNAHECMIDCSDDNSGYCDDIKRW